MKTNPYALILETVESAQKILNENDPGYTIVRDETDHSVKIVDPAGVVHATISENGIVQKQVL